MNQREPGRRLFEPDTPETLETESCSIQKPDPTKYPKPQTAPGDVPGIGGEYQHMGVTDESGEDDKDWKKSEDRM